MKLHPDYPKTNKQEVKSIRKDVGEQPSNKSTNVDLANEYNSIPAPRNGVIEKDNEIIEKSIEGLYNPNSKKIDKIDDMWVYFTDGYHLEIGSMRKAIRLSFLSKEKEMLDDEIEFLKELYDNIEVDYEGDKTGKSIKERLQKLKGDKNNG